MFQYITKGGRKRWINTKRRDRIVRMISLTRGGNRIGAFATAEDSDGKIYVGWSLCHTKIDKFDSLRAISIAEWRAKKNNTNTLPPSIEKQAKRFMERAIRYYKGKEVVPAFSWPTHVKHIRRQSFIRRIFDSIISYKAGK